MCLIERHYVHRIIKIASIFLFITIKAQGQPQQRIGQWKSFTDMKSVRSATLVGGSIWAATSGGIFAFDTASGLFAKFTNTDGLATNDVRAIAYDGANHIWIGSAGGWVNIYNINTQQWQTISDIADKEREYTNRAIRSFEFKGDTVFIVTEFGVSVFKLTRWEFGETYSNLGFSSSPQVSCMVLQENRIWIGTTAGLATALLSVPYPWTNYTSSAGLPSNSITTLAVFNNTLVIGTDNGIAYFSNETFNSIASFKGKNICDLQIVDDKLLVLSSSGSNFTVETITSVFGTPQTITSNYEVQGVCMVPAFSLWIATSSKGLAQSVSPTICNYFYPNGPNSNFFSSLIVDANNVLWCGSGETAEAGFYKFNPALPENTQWKNFTSDLYPKMKKDGNRFDDYHKVSLGTDGSIWVSSWGDGLAEVAGDTIRRKLNYDSYPDLQGADPTISEYVVGGGTAVDEEGGTWIIVRSNSHDKTLLRLDNSNDTIGNYYPTPMSYINFHDIIIDLNGTKWIATTVPWKMESHGLMFFNEKRIVAGTQGTNGWGLLSKSNGLSSDVALSLAMDLKGEVWAGLELGVVIIPDPLNPKALRTSFPLREQIVQSIAVDAINNKWIGTKEGVFVVSTDGTQLLQSYTVASTNNYLLSNDVRAIAIDQKRGIAYFGTEQGLSSLSIEPMQTEQEYSGLEIAPNPFLLPNKQPLIIRNLVVNTTIKILTVSGNVVAQFEAQGGGRAFWDGRNKNGALVSSGIYFIVAFAENGKQTVTGKVAIIRH